MGRGGGPDPQALKATRPSFSTSLVSLRPLKAAMAITSTQEAQREQMSSYPSLPYVC